MVEKLAIDKFEFDILDSGGKLRLYTVQAFGCEGDGMLLVAKEVGSDNGGEHFSVFGPKEKLDFLKTELFIGAYKGLKNGKGGNGDSAMQIPLCPHHSDTSMAIT